MKGETTHCQLLKERDGISGHIFTLGEPGSLLNIIGGVRIDVEM